MKEPNAKKNACWVPKIVVIKVKNFNYFTEIVYGSNPYSPKLLKYLVFELLLSSPLFVYSLYIYIYIEYSYVYMNKISN